MNRVIECPTCDERSFPVWQKQVLGPGRKKRRRRCEQIMLKGVLLLDSEGRPVDKFFFRRE